MKKKKICIRYLGVQEYPDTLKKMCDFTKYRGTNTHDEIWLVEHFPVFTKGKYGKKVQVKNKNDIPIVQSDRGGQITYHGLGQQIVYILLDLRRRKIGVRNLVSILEQAVISTLKVHKIRSYTLEGLPGVYVSGRKICSLGLRIRNGCTYHGLAFNISMDLSPFLCIHPCGIKGMQMTQMQEWYPNAEIDEVSTILVKILTSLIP